MNFSHEMGEKIKKFAQKEVPHYLDEAEMTYMEKIRQEINQGKNKLVRSLNKFKNRSDSFLDAQNDMILYMSEYINDLIAQGLTEDEALERAKEEFRFRSDNSGSLDLQERFTSYYENIDPAAYEVIGLFYAGFIFLGLSLGGLTGFLASGGRHMFLMGGWIDTLIGTAIGLFIGLGLGLFSNAIFVLKRK